MLSPVTSPKERQPGCFITEFHKILDISEKSWFNNFVSSRNGGVGLKRLNTLSETSFLKGFFLFFSCSFLIAAFFMPDRQTMLSGLWKIFSNPTLSGTSFFDVGGYAATFLNMGLNGLVCTAFFWIPGQKECHSATLVTILTTGFGSWGIHILNMWPTMLGVLLYCAVKKEKIGDKSNDFLFTTGLAPFMSELMIRYPNAAVTGFSLQGLLLAALVGTIAGFFVPAGLDRSHAVHKDFSLYSAALPVGMTAFILQGSLYKAMGVEIPGAVTSLSMTSPTIVNTFCCILFGCWIVAALLMGCRPKDYRELLMDPDQVKDFAARYDNATFLMNAGMFGLFILSYYNLIGAPFNGITFGVIFCMLCTCNAGSHPANVWPIVLGYALASYGFRFLSPVFGGEFTPFLNAQSIVVGLCYANGLSPVADQYGWLYGTAAAMMHFCMVTTVPVLHGGMCLYNGGFTAALVCILIVPGLERHFRTKQERRGLRIP